MNDSGKGDAEKARYWQRTISEAVQSGISIRQFCRQRRQNCRIDMPLCSASLIVLCQ